MALRPFVRIRLGPDEEPDAKHINLVQDNVQKAFDQLTGDDYLDGKTIQRVKLNPSGANYVNHGLGRPPQGVFKVRQYGTGTNIDVWDTQDMNTAQNKKLQIILWASATGTFDLRIW